MEVPYFFTDENNDVVEVDTFDNAMNTIKLRYQKLQDKIGHLSQENKELKSGVFATNYVQEALANAEKIRNEYRLGFPMTEEEVQKAEKWMKEHDESAHNGKSSGAIGGRYTYEFTPTSIGVFCGLRCSCGASVTLTDFNTL